MSTATTIAKADAFRALHAGPDLFVIGNAWDAGSAMLLAQMGCRALATTSAGFAYASGRLDGAPSRQQVLDNAQIIVGATPLPVSADLLNGFGDSPEAVAETVRLAADMGLVGCTIEDVTGRAEDPVYDRGLAQARIAAAAEAAKGLPHAFTLTARADGFLRGVYDLPEAIARLQSFQEVGADVLYAPGPKDLDSVKSIVNAVDRPVNVLAGIGGELTIAQLAEAGVRRVSVGSSLYAATMGLLRQAAEELMGPGTFDWARLCMSSRDLSAMVTAAGSSGGQ